MNYAIHRISLDVTDDSPSQLTIAAKQGDTAKILIISLLDDKKNYQIAQGSVAVFIAKKSNGIWLEHPCTIDYKSNKVLYTFKEDTVRASGTLECEIHLSFPTFVITEDGKTEVVHEDLTTASFVIAVHDTILTGLTGTTEEASLLPELITKGSSLFAKLEEETIPNVETATANAEKLINDFEKKVANEGYWATNLANGGAGASLKQTNFSQDGLHSDYSHFTISSLALAYEAIDGLQGSDRDKILADIEANTLITSEKVSQKMTSNSYESIRSDFISKNRKIPNDVSVIDKLLSGTMSTADLLAELTKYTLGIGWKKVSNEEEVDKFVKDAIDSSFSGFATSNLEDTPNAVYGTASSAFGANQEIYSPFSIVGGYGNTVGTKGSFPHESAANAVFGYNLRVDGQGNLVGGGNHDLRCDFGIVGGTEHKISKSSYGLLVSGINNTVENSQYGILSGRGLKSIGNYYKAIFGSYNEDDPNNIFEVGIGSGEDSRLNGFSINKNGTFKFQLRHDTPVTYASEIPNSLKIGGYLNCGGTLESTGNIISKNTITAKKGLKIVDADSSPNSYIMGTFYQADTDGTAIIYKHKDANGNINFDKISALHYWGNVNFVGNTKCSKLKLGSWDASTSGDGKVIVIGNGTAWNKLSNSFELDKEGNINTDGTITAYSIWCNSTLHASNIMCGGQIMVDSEPCHEYSVVRKKELDELKAMYNELKRQMENLYAFVQGIK